MSFHPLLRVAALLACVFAPLIPQSAALAQEAPASDAAGSIEGIVTLTGGGPATDAEVVLADTGRRAAVDADGRFRFADLDAGTYLLEAHSLSAGSAISRLVLAPGERAEVGLVLGLAGHSEEIFVSAAPYARERLDVAQATSVLLGEELSLRLRPSLGETLSEEPGVNSSYFGPGASRPIIRGLDGDRVRTLQDGVGTGDAAVTSPDHAVSVEPALADRIEVIRGPATLLYGSSAIGGVVNVIDGSMPSYRAEKPISGTLEVSAGSVADERSGALHLDGGAGSFAWHLGASRRETDDYEIPGFAESAALRALEEAEDDHGDDDGDEHGEEEEARDILENSDLETESASLGLTYFAAEGISLGFAVTGLDSNYGIPGGHGHEEEHGDGNDDHGDEEEEEEGGVRIDLEQRRADFRLNVDRSLGVFQGAKLRVGWTDYEHRELEGAEGEVGTTFFNDSLEGRLELVQKERGRSRGAVGLQFRKRDLNAVGEEAFIPKNQADSLALFTFQEIDLGVVSWQLGARFERQETEARGSGLPDRTFDGLSASAGLVWDFTEGYSLGASLARSVKTPTGEELYANGAHLATQTFEVGDPTLDEETSLGFDVVLRKTTGRVTGELSLFVNRFDGFIYERFTGEEEDGLAVAQFTQADAEFIGAELDLRFGLYQQGRRHVDLRLTGDTVRAELRADGEPLPRIPPRRLSLGLHYGDDRFHAMVEGRWVDEQDRVSANELPTDGYTLVNASAGYRFFLGERVLDVMLRGRNLTDEEARSHTSFLKDLVPQPGRDLALVLRLGF